MRNTDRANTLLLELLIAVLFFSVAVAGIVRVLAGAWELTGRTEAHAALLTEAQQTAERLYAASDPETVLAERGFARAETTGKWIKTAGAMMLTVQISESESMNGVMRRCSVTGTESGGGQVNTTLFSLPCDRFIPQEVHDD